MLQHYGTAIRSTQSGVRATAQPVCQCHAPGSAVGAHCPASRASIPLAVLLLHATLQAKGAAASYATLQNACRQRADSLHLVSTLTLGEPACLGNLGW